jgi:branched-chain amino acid aminotransferase
MFNPLSPTDDVGLHITSTPAPRSAAYREGVSATVSSWRRIAADAAPPSIKTGANYHNSRLAHHEALRNGYDVAILLNARGTVAEAADANIVLSVDGHLVAPPSTSGALEGITLRTVFELADEMGLRVARREVDRTELYDADEVFLCGTLAEIKPITSIDSLSVGDRRPGQLTRELQSLFDARTRTAAAGEDWSTVVGSPDAEEAS